MPELPEVEIARRQLARWLRDETIVQVRTPEPRSVREIAPAAFRRALRGARVLAVERLGKHLLLRLPEDQVCWIHLGMSGKLALRTKGSPVPRFARIAVFTASHVVELIDPRIFGGVDAGPREDVLTRHHLDALGPDAWREGAGLTGAELRAALTARPSAQPLKVLLMDQRRLAGIGNIQAAEALYRAGLHPARGTASLAPAEWDRLAAGLHATLAHTLAVTTPAEESEAVAYLSEGGHLESPFLVYGREGQPCGRCGASIVRAQHGGRSTYACPSCQPA